MIDALEHQARQGLDDAMRNILARLELVSNGTTASWNPTSGSQTATTRPGQGHPEGLPAGDPQAPHIYWRARYDRCRTNPQRSEIIRLAEEDLKLITGRYERHAVGETPEETIRRMLRETEGWTPGEIEQSSWRISARMVRRHRVNNGRHAETGQPTAITAAVDDTPAQKARELDDRGMSLRQIAMILGKDKKQIQRYLGRAA